MSDRDETMDDAAPNDAEMKEGPDDDDDDSVHYEDVDTEEDASEGEDEEEDEEDGEGEDEEEEANKGPSETYLPGKPLEEGEELVCDENAYLMFHQANTGKMLFYIDINVILSMQL